MAGQKAPMLVVDDEPELLAAIEEAMRSEDFNVMAFQSSQKALERACSLTEPFVLLTDLRLPGMDGLELVREIRRVAGEPRRFETILISGYPDMDRAIEALKLGVLDFLLKPVDLERLLQTCHRALDSLDSDQSGPPVELTLQRDLVATLTKARELTRELESAARKVLPAPAAETMVQAPQLGGKDRILAVVKRLQQLRALRNRHLSVCADGDPIWEILLYITEQHVLGRPVSVTSACHAASVPPSTAMRKLDELVGMGWLSRRGDPKDKRRILLEPTAQCEQRVNEHLLAAAQLLGL